MACFGCTCRSPTSRPPDHPLLAAWRKHGPGLISGLSDGSRVLVHCKGGLGRAGTIAALMLVELGMTVDEAIRTVRAARPGAIETRAQEAFVMGRAWQTA